MYKKEAFEKFQSLLIRLRKDVTLYLMNFDFSVKKPEPMIEIPVDPDYLNILEQASQSAKKSSVASSKDGVEVIEVIDSSPKSPYEKIFEKTSVKAKPNDPCPCGS
jgi:preprotein translocase subunit SecA